MATIQFNRTDEFLEELHRDAVVSRISRRIVRVTALHRPAIYSDGKGGKSVVPWIRRISLVATYELARVLGVVRLEEFVGEQTESGAAGRERADLGPDHDAETADRSGLRRAPARGARWLEVRGGELTEATA